MEPFTPTFYEGVYHCPAYHPDGTPNLDKSFKTYVKRRQFATPETARWVGELYNASYVGERPYLGFGEAFDVNEQSVQQTYVTIDGVDMTAGEVAYYFTKLPKDYEPEPIPNDPGMWPYDLPDDEVMARGKAEADKWVKSSVEHTDRE